MLRIGVSSCSRWSSTGFCKSASGPALTTSANPSTLCCSPTRTEMEEASSVCVDCAFRLGNLITASSGRCKNGLQLKTLGAWQARNTHAVAAVKILVLREI